MRIAVWSGVLRTRAVIFFICGKFLEFVGGAIAAGADDILAGRS
jgi:hypothetical protein